MYKDKETHFLIKNKIKVIQITNSSRRLLKKEWFPRGQLFRRPLWQELVKQFHSKGDPVLLSSSWLTITKFLTFSPQASACIYSPVQVISNQILNYSISPTHKAIQINQLIYLSQKSSCLQCNTVLSWQIRTEPYRLRLWSSWSQSTVESTWNLKINRSRTQNL